ncbi:hypothetical protein R6Q59_014748 [Mikania micrantha]
MALQENTVTDIIDINLINVYQEPKVVKEIREETNMKTIIEECVASTVKIGVSCSMDSPTQRMDIKNVFGKTKMSLGYPKIQAKGVSPLLIFGIPKD